MGQNETGRQAGRRSARLTPDQVRALWESGEVSAAQTLPWGQVLDCLDYVRQASAEELAARREAVQQTAARLLWTCSPPAGESAGDGEARPWDPVTPP